MAVELGRYIVESLEKLPKSHPDRKFLEGVGGITEAYLTNKQQVESPESSIARSVDPTSSNDFNLLGLGERLNFHLRLNGYSTTDDIDHATDEQLLSVALIGPKRLGLIRERIAEHRKNNPGQQP